MNLGTRNDVNASADLVGASASVLQASHSFEPVEKKELIDLAYDEFCRLREAGESPDPDEFCQAFPYQSSLRRLLEVDRLVQDHPSLLDKETAKDWPEPGDRFLGFVLLRELGRGAFARVFLAKEPALGNRRVAVKVALHGAAEAETLGRLEHRNIVSVHSAQKDEATGLTAVCMPYLGASNLCHLLDRVASGLPLTAEAVQQAIDETRSPDETPLPRRWTSKESYVDAVAEIGEQLADGLASIHAQGICHRDLKPSNVLLAADGRAMLLDFNLSFDSQASEQRLGGTLPYMSPEHLRATDPHLPADAAAVDARSDLFSLGVLLYELLTGTHPFGAVPLKWSAEQVREHLRRKHQEGPLPLRLGNPRVNKTLARLIERCLAAKSADRPQSAAELSAALRRTRPLVSRARRWVAGHVRFLAAASVLVLAAGAVGAFGTYSLTPSSEEQVKKGHAYYQQGEYEKAVKEFKGALKVEKNNAELLFACGRAYQQLADQTADNSESYLAALSCYDAADEIVTRSNDPNNRGGLIRACRAYCLNRRGQPDQAIIEYKQALKAGFENERVHNNLGYSYRVCLNIESEKMRIDCAESELNAALQRNDNMQAAHYNRALLHTDMVAKVSRFRSDSPQMDIDRAALLPPPSRRLCLDAAHLYAFGASRYGKLAQKYAEQAQAGYSGAFALDESHGMARFVCESVHFAWADSEARFHREQATAYLRQALEMGQDREKAKKDLFLQPFFKEIRDDLNVMPVVEKDVLLLDPVQDRDN